MYDQLSTDKCSSACFTTARSQLLGQYIRVDYTDMTDACTNGGKITIECEGFKNPIYQDEWDGFYVEAWDDEPIAKLIERSIPTILDTRAYEPATMPARVLQVEPFDTTVNTKSSWTLSLAPTVPLGEECYIVLLLPYDLEYSFEFVEAEGIFLPRNQQSILSTSDMEIVEGFKGDGRQSVKFFGCN